VRYTNSSGNYNVDVIEFPWRVWFYSESQGQTVINQWLNEIDAPEPDRSRLRALLTLYKSCGLRSIASSVQDIGDGLSALISIRKGGLSLAPIFSQGPFSDTEITFLQGAFLKGNTTRPYSAKGAALENLENRQQEPARRRYERITEGT
jgi:hypothetical protein